MEQIEEESQPRRVIYLPPASHRLEDYSQQVCHDLGEEFTEPEVIEGFTQFVKVAVRIMARHLNGGTFDNDTE
ncbi:MAG: hypothetical protein F9K27_17050 [Anaerolineae bacterium]|nr:MAG: hypothetical protein F9K27_17050 [Anaerolineae bacterium]